MATDLTAKRLEILKDMLPQLRRVLTFYNPNNPSAQEAAKLAREAAQGLRIELLERHVASLQDLRAGLQTLKAREADAFIMLSDAMVLSHVQMIIDAARNVKSPTMFWEYNSVEKGGVASYGVSYHEVGRASAKYIQRVLAGAKPKDLPVEGFRKLELVINVRAGRQLGLTIPPNVLARADKVIR